MSDIKFDKHQLANTDDLFKIEQPFLLLLVHSAFKNLPAFCFSEIEFNFSPLLQYS